MYSHPSPAQSNTSLSDEDREEDDLDKSTLFLEPVSTARWSSRKGQLTGYEANKSVIAQHSPASQLPPEILIHILKQLHNPSDLCSTLLVSRTWCECSVELLWHKPHFSKHSSLFKMISVIGRKDMTFTYPRFVRRLNFLALGSELSNQLFTRLSVCSRLERLALVNCGSISDEALTAVLPCCPNLVALDLTNVVETTDRAVLALASTARRLQGLNLGGCKLVTHKGVLAIAESCPQLRRIKLNGLELLTDEAVSALAMLCPLLLEIDLNGCERITNTSVRDLWTNSIYMRELRLCHCPELSSDGFPAPPKEIPPPGPNPFPSSTPLHDPELPPLRLPRPFEHLRILDLTSCGNLSDAAIEGIVTNAPKIRNLVLAKCGGLTDDAVESICKLGKNLHYLHLGHATGITDRSVKKLARSCSRLRYIDLACCALLTDLSVFELASLPKLRRIGLVRVSNLTDQAIMSLGEERHDTLERIHLSYCEQITVAAIHYLLQKLTRLTHLSLTGIPAFRDTELQQYCRPPPREFNSTQRAAFCVYSGTGVRDLRRYLETIMPQIGDDRGARYDSDEDEHGELFSGENVDDSERDEYTNGGLFVSPSRTRRERSGLSTARIPTTQPQNSTFYPPLSPSPDVFIQGGSTTPGIASTPTITNPFDRQASEQQTPTGPFRRLTVFMRGNSLLNANGRTTQSRSTPSGSNSVRSSQSNGVGFMTSYDPVVMQANEAAAARAGAATPDLVYAEQGHGPGANGAASRLIAWLDSRVPIDEESSYPPPYDPWHTNDDAEATGSARQNYTTATVTSTPSAGQTLTPHGVRFPPRDGTHAYHSRSPSPSPSASPSQANRELEESVHTALGGLALNDGARWEDGRGRRSRLSLRNTLNAAEHYASSLLFGRNGPGSSPGHGGVPGSGRAGR